jgi:hypothetical protein
MHALILLLFRRNAFRDMANEVGSTLVSKLVHFLVHTYVRGDSFYLSRPVNLRKSFISKVLRRSHCGI